jgi:hypothetical protein
MASFVRVENGIVVESIVAEQEFIDSGAVGDPSSWIQTSRNTRNGIHYGQDGNPDNGVALRGNFAGIGYIYNSELDIFYEPQPYPSWILDKEKAQWIPPIEYPDDGRMHFWDEELKQWIPAES